MTVALLLVFARIQSAMGYSLEGVSWPAGSSVTFHLGLGSAGRTLIDGNTSWDAAAAPAATAWDNVVGRLQFVTSAGGAVASSGDRVNSIFFARTYFGQSFGSSTLAVTQYLISSGRITEADVAFNSNQTFDSYRGPLRYGSNRYAIADIRRVLIHELGHALGLAHPDQHGQNVDAIMNSMISDRETVSADDIRGAQSMYGAPSPTPTPAPTATPIPSSLAQFSNISTRMNVGTGNNVAIGGFVVSGTQSKTVIIRALGPTLGSLGVSNVLSDPMLELHNSAGTLIASNDDWQTSSQSSQIASSGYAPSNENESALLVNLIPGSYTAIVRGYSNSVGTALVEIYAVDSGSAKLSNISTRAAVATGDGVVIGGLSVAGGSKNVILRALGPALTSPPFSLTGTLPDPVVELRDGSGTLLMSNDDWTTGSQAPAISGSGYAPPNGIESALLATLSPGNYTAIVHGYNNATGIALIEAYDLDR